MPLSQVGHRPSLTSTSSWLSAALRALDAIDDEIAEDRLPAIGRFPRTAAERILVALAAHPLEPTVYPTQNAEVAIHFKSPHRPDSVLILLDNHGRAECYACSGGHSRRAHYDAASDLPDRFILDRLRALTPESMPARRRRCGGP